MSVDRARLALAGAAAATAIALACARPARVPGGEICSLDGEARVERHDAPTVDSTLLSRGEGALAFQILYGQAREPTVVSLVVRGNTGRPVWGGVSTSDTTRLVTTAPLPAGDIQVNLRTLRSTPDTTLQTTVRSGFQDTLRVFIRRHMCVWS